MLWICFPLSFFPCRDDANAVIYSLDLVANVVILSICSLWPLVLALRHDKYGFNRILEVLFPTVLLSSTLRSYNLTIHMHAGVSSRKVSWVGIYQIQYFIPVHSFSFLLQRDNTFKSSRNDSNQSESPRPVRGVSRSRNVRREFIFLRRSHQISRLYTYYHRWQVCLFIFEHVQL